MVAKLRGVLGIKKIGHAGTLDPLAEGVLVVLTEKDTKKQDSFMKMEKEYVAEIAFGAASESYDLERELVVSEGGMLGVVGVDGIREQLEKALPSFAGEIEQTVPPYSAVKVKGKRLYKHAHKGRKIENLPVKKVTLYSSEILSVLEKEIAPKVVLPTAKIKITCSSGFYVRSLAHDLGERLGTGAVLVSLVRTKVGNYKVEDSKTIESLSQQ